MFINLKIADYLEMCWGEDIFNIIAMCISLLLGQFVETLGHYKFHIYTHNCMSYPEWVSIVKYFI